MSSGTAYQTSISFVATHASMEWINHFRLPATGNENFWSAIGKRVAAEFIFLALIPLSCAEAVARLALTVFALLATCIGVSDEQQEWLWEVTLLGAGASGLACIASFLAVFDNLYYNGLYYDVGPSHFSLLHSFASYLREH